MTLLDGNDDDADLGNANTRPRITVNQLLEREGFRPVRSRLNCPLIGVAVFAVGAVVVGMLMTQPSGATLASGSATDGTSTSARHPTGSVDPTDRSATGEGIGGAHPNTTQPPAAPIPPAVPGGAPSQPVVVTAPSISNALKEPGSAPSGRSAQSPAVQPAPAPVVHAVVAPVTHVVTSVVAPVVAPVVRAVVPVVRAVPPMVTPVVHAVVPVVAPVVHVAAPTVAPAITLAGILAAIVQRSVFIGTSNSATQPQFGRSHR